VNGIQNIAITKSDAAKLIKYIFKSVRDRRPLAKTKTTKRFPVMDRIVVSEYRIINPITPPFGIGGYE
jgi:hypothetical protein